MARYFLECFTAVKHYDLLSFPNSVLFPETASKEAMEIYKETEKMYNKMRYLALTVKKKRDELEKLSREFSNKTVATLKSKYSGLLKLHKKTTAPKKVIVDIIASTVIPEYPNCKFEYNELLKLNYQFWCSNKNTIIQVLRTREKHLLELREKSLSDMNQLQNALEKLIQEKSKEIDEKLQKSIIKLKESGVNE